MKNEFNIEINFLNVNNKKCYRKQNAKKIDKFKGTFKKYIDRIQRKR